MGLGRDASSQIYIYISIDRDPFQVTPQVAPSTSSHSSDPESC